MGLTLRTTVIHDLLQLYCCWINRDIGMLLFSGFSFLPGVSLVTMLLYFFTISSNTRGGLLFMGILGPGVIPHVPYPPPPS